MPKPPTRQTMSDSEEKQTPELAPAEPPQQETEPGLNIDMTDVDRLNDWARLIDAHGPDIGQWGSCQFVVISLRDIATRMAQEIKDVGELRKPRLEPQPTFTEYRRVVEALNLCLAALERHDGWCGYKKDSPGDAIYRRAEEAARAALWPTVEAKSDTNLIQLAPSEPRTAAAEIPGYGDFMKALGQELVPVAPAEPPQQDEPGYESERLQQEKERPRFSKPVAAEPRPNRVGIIVHCARCGYMKKPIGRSGPLGAVYCDEDCAGYRQPPFVGSLWPGETSEDFGYPVGTDGTEAK